MPAIKSAENSTTVRADKKPNSLLLARNALRGLDAVAPSLAARVALRWMFRTQRRDMESWERDVARPAEQLFIEGPSGAIAAYRWGQGPLVVLVHGWNGRASQLGAFVSPLVDAGYQVVAFDAPGHGASQGSRSSVVEFADAFDRVLDAVRPFFRPIHGVIAHSMGGAAVTLSLARAAGHWRPSDARQSDGAFEVPRLVFIAPPIDLREMTAGFSDALSLGGATRSAMNGLVEKQLGSTLDEMNGLRLAPAMRSPLLVLHDETDRAVPIENGRRLAAAWPAAELCVTRGLGHSRILRDRAAVSRAIGFIRAETAD